MTREQQINKAAFANSNNLSEVISFVRGARWADKHPNLASLWHEASEEPNGNSEILIKWNVKGQSGYESYYTSTIENWMTFIEKYGVSKWAYIENLLQSNSEIPNN